MKIAKIIIIGESGYCRIEESYNDTLSFSKDTITYELYPCCESQNGICQKWTYKSNSQFFENVFGEVCELLPRYIDSDDKLDCTDIGAIEFIIVYEDKSRRKEKFFCPSEYFRELFMMIRKLVPISEEMPRILTLDDCGETASI